MVRVLKTGSKATKARARKAGEKGHKSTKTKRGIASSVTRHRALSVADLQSQLERRNTELGLALDRQTATADILGVIANSPSDVQPVFEAIAQSAARLCQAEFCNVFRFDGELIHFMHSYGYSLEAIEDLRRPYPVRPGRGSCAGRAILSGKVEQIPDVRSDPEYAQGNVPDIMKISSVVAVPMLKERRPVGAIALIRAGKGNFPQRQIDLLKTFADQAMIAIENARLFDEVQTKTRDLEESLQQQTATANVLKVISRSAFDLQTVLDTLVQSAVTLSGAPTGTIFQKRGELYHLTAQCGYTPEMLAYGSAHPIAPSMGSNVGRTAITGAVVQIPDVLADPDFTAHGYQRVGNYRAMLGIPLKRDGKVEGVFSLAKPEPGPFEPRHVELVQIFADQAVIAIENVRLFEEVQAKTRDLEESLQQQTATADVLKVISRSAFDLDTVMNTLARSARELCGSKTAVLFLRDGEFLFCRGAAAVKRVDEEFMRENPVELNNDSHIGRAVLTGTIANVGDILNSHTKLRKFQQAMGFRSFLAVPLMREGRGIGVFALSRDELGTFSQRQVDLVQGFADQAVIAIENVRLFDEVQARTRELVKSLDDLRTAQDRLIQTEKLASLGQLTAGIAHEIKNPLNFVNNFSTLSAELTDELNDLLKRERLTDKGRQEADELTRLLQDNLSKVVQHGKRADSIVKNMLLHSREGSGERRLVDVNALVTESLNLAYHGARAEKAGFSITLKHDLDPEAGALDLYPQEMTRALLNMISNGFYAATKRKLEVGDGTFEPILSVATTNFDKTVEIRIRDNGTGIPLEVRENIFNPFFTTKPTGEGTGLGLSMTHDIIVKQHGGRIDVETEPGVFTEFIITLPRETGAATG